MRYKSVVRMLALPALVGSLLLLAAYIFLPAVIENRLKKKLTQLAAPNRIDFRIDKIGVMHTAVAGITVNDGIEIDHADLYYSIGKKIRIKKLVLSGVRINARLNRADPFNFSGLVPPGKKRAAPMDVQPYFLYFPDMVRIKNSSFRIHGDDRVFDIPFDLLGAFDKTDREIVCSGTVYPFGEAINTEWVWRPEPGLRHVVVQSRAFDLMPLNKWISPATSPYSLSGHANVYLESDAPGKAWSLSISPVGVATRSFHANISDLTSDIKKAGKKFTAKGGFTLSLASASKLPLSYAFSFDPDLSLPFAFELENRKTGGFRINHNGFQGGFQSLSLKLEGVADTEKSLGSVQVEAGAGNVLYRGKSTAVSSASADTAFHIGFLQERPRIHVKPQIFLSGLNHSAGFGNFSFKQVHLSGTAAYDKTAGPGVNMLMGVSGGSLEMPLYRARAFNINFELPFRFPFVQDSKKGRYQIGNAVYQGQYRLGAAGRIMQTGDNALQVNGKITLEQLPGLDLNYVCNMGYDKTPEVSIAWDVAPLLIDAQDARHLFSKLPPGLTMAAAVSGNGAAGLSGGKVETSMGLHITNGRFSLPEMNLDVQGINTKILFNDLIVPETAPGQIVTAEAIAIDQIKIGRASMRFSVEDARYLLVENMKFNWCGGIVSTEAIRLPQDQNRYTLILYCDRLDLAELLQQMGIFQAEGNGTLNGRIPLVYKDGNIVFDNAFLFSTPGSGGTVKIKNPEKLTAGIPMDSPQLGQLDLTQEALKDFEYKWAKLVFDTLDQTLFVTMEMDGKPSGVLPFEYREEFGGFSRVEAGHPGSHFQGIKLDVNLNLPFNEVMQYGNKLKSIFND